MHPRQANIVQHASALAMRIAAKGKQSEKKQGVGVGGQALLWEYTDPEGKTFYLEEKKTTVKSPFTGKAFTSRPTRHTPAQVGKEMKDEAKAEKETAKVAAMIFWEYTDPEGNLFLLPEKRMTVKSPYSGKTFTTRPIRHLGQMRDLDAWGVPGQEDVLDEELWAPI